jgi:hemin uptake protein HemP
MSCKLPSKSLAPRLIVSAHQMTNQSVDRVATQARRISSRTLLGESTSLVIDHEGVAYILRATRLGKLILTK